MVREHSREEQASDDDEGPENDFSQFILVAV
jgi:hypothetical protein